MTWLNYTFHTTFPLFLRPSRQADGAGVGRGAASAQTAPRRAAPPRPAPKGPLTDWHASGGARRSVERAHCRWSLLLLLLLLLLLVVLLLLLL
jgi:hypothetical protein